MTDDDDDDDDDDNDDDDEREKDEMKGEQNNRVKLHSRNDAFTRSLHFSNISMASSYRLDASVNRVNDSGEIANLLCKYRPSSFNTPAKAEVEGERNERDVSKS